jgi:hypothetical protein
VTDPIAALIRLADEGRRLRGSNEAAIVGDDFEAERDLDDIVDAVVWRPAEPLRIAWADLRALGEVAIPPRLPDSGQLVAVAYVPGGRLLLVLGDDDGRVVHVTEARFTGR